MKGRVLYGTRDIGFEERDLPKIIPQTDAISRIAATCVCGSDLWPYVLIPSLLATSDVLLGTGWFAADAAHVKPGMTVALVGDGAVGLLGVISAKQWSPPEFEAVQNSINDRIDEAYRAKYRPSEYLKPVIGARPRSAAAKIMPREIAA